MSKRDRKNTETNDQEIKKKNRKTKHVDEDVENLQETCARDDEQLSRADDFVETIRKLQASIELQHQQSREKEDLFQDLLQKHQELLSKMAAKDQPESQPRKGELCRFGGLLKCFGVLDDSVAVQLAELKQNNQRLKVENEALNQKLSAQTGLMIFYILVIC
jgi:hypothetical protein